MNKILAQMMLKCRDKITDLQVVELQKFKDAAPDFDSTQPTYSVLLDFDLKRFEINPNLPKEKQEGPVEMSTAENNM